MRREDDRETKERISRIIQRAKEIVRTSQEHNCNPVENIELFPVPQNILYTADENQRPLLRLSSACYDCLKDFDNQLEHQYLDRFDALQILNALISDEEAEELLTEPDQPEENIPEDVVEEREAVVVEEPAPAGNEDSRNTVSPAGYEAFDPDCHSPEGAWCYMRGANTPVEFDNSIHDRSEIVWIEKD